MYHAKNVRPTKKQTAIIIVKKWDKKNHIQARNSGQHEKIKCLQNKIQKYSLNKLHTMENLGYREGTSKLSKHRRMSRAASLAVDAEGIPLSR